ncbi:unnamed protein product [Meloidogyne enterolobii]|uniref:Uncharacterized protein n=1 Tax=Meloidogyne enterolobii TaxID=390850 RepID=A0ACB0ZA15_MELEN
MVYHMDTYTINQTPPYIHYLIPISIFIGLLLITSIINCYYNHLKKRNRRRIEERKGEDRREARRQDAYARCARNIARMRMQRKNVSLNSLKNPKFPLLFRNTIINQLHLKTPIPRV